MNEEETKRIRWNAPKAPIYGRKVCGGGQVRAAGRRGRGTLMVGSARNILDVVILGWDKESQPNKLGPEGLRHTLH